MLAIVALAEGIVQSSRASMPLGVVARKRLAFKLRHFSGDQTRRRQIEHVQRTAHLAALRLRQEVVTINHAIIHQQHVLTAVLRLVDDLRRRPTRPQRAQVLARRHQIRRVRLRQQLAQCHAIMHQRRVLLRIHKPRHIRLHLLRQTTQRHVLHVRRKHHLHPHTLSHPRLSRRLHPLALDPHHSDLPVFFSLRFCAFLRPSPPKFPVATRGHAVHRVTALPFVRGTHQRPDQCPRARPMHTHRLAPNPENLPRDLRNLHLGLALHQHPAQVATRRPRDRRIPRAFFHRTCGLRVSKMRGGSMRALRSHACRRLSNPHVDIPRKTSRGRKSSPPHKPTRQRPLHNAAGFFASRSLFTLQRVPGTLFTLQRVRLRFKSPFFCLPIFLPSSDSNPHFSPPIFLPALHLYPPTFHASTFSHKNIGFPCLMLNSS